MTMYAVTYKTTVTLTATVEANTAAAADEKAWDDAHGWVKYNLNRQGMPGLELEASLDGIEADSIVAVDGAE